MTSRTLDFISHFSHTALNAMRPLVDEGPHYQHYPVHLSKEWGSPYVQSPACLTFSLYHNSKCCLKMSSSGPGQGLSIHNYMDIMAVLPYITIYAYQLLMQLLEDTQGSHLRPWPAACLRSTPPPSSAKRGKTAPPKASQL